MRSNNCLQLTFFPLRPSALRSKNSLRSALRAATEAKRYARILKTQITMKLKTIFLLLCLLGALLPLSQFLPWLAVNGLNFPLFFQELFSTKIGAFFGLDVIVSAIVLFVFMYSERKEMEISSLWLPILATLCIGVSVGFPLYLYMRQSHIELVAFKGAHLEC